MIQRLFRFNTALPSRGRTLWVLGLLLALFGPIGVRAQSSTLSYYGVIDTYYAYDPQATPEHELPWFIYNLKRSEEVTVNLAMMHATYLSSSVRANLGLMAGTYAQYNLFAEQETMRSIYEANIGLALGDSSGWWLDVGIIPSHIGFESVALMDDWTISRSLACESSPFYLSGARITAPLGSDVSAMALVCNGWQRIRRVSSNTALCVGTQLQWKATPSLFLNWSTFIGSDDPDSVGRQRSFHDVYVQAQLSKRLQVLAGYDLGYQAKSSAVGAPSLHWSTPVVQFKFQATPKVALSLRMEYFDDPHGIIINDGTQGVSLTATTICAEYMPKPTVCLRAEQRWMEADRPVFSNANAPSDSKTIWMLSLSFRTP